MALAVRSNGSLSINLINATWFNDIRDLLTGAMTDQPVKIISNVTSQAIGTAPAAPTAAIQAAGSVDVGAHTYAVTHVAADGGETAPGTTVIATTTAGNQTVALSIIPTGPTGATARKIYRSKAGTTSPLFLVTTLNDNTTTTYSDAATDASLSATQPPKHSSFGGSLTVKDGTGTTKGQVFSDGAVLFDGGLITSDGAGGLNVSNNLVMGGTLVFGPSVGSSNAQAFFLAGISAVQLQTPQAGASALGISFGTYTGSAGAIPFSIGGQFNLAKAWVDNSGNYNGPGGGGIPTTRNGAALSVPIYTGTTPPVNPPTGSIWIKA